MKKALMLIVPLALLAGGWGIYSAAQGSDEYAVKVGDEKIDAESVERAVAMRARASGAAEDAVDRGAVVQQIIEDSLMTQEAERRGLTCSTEEALLSLDGIPEAEIERAAGLSGVTAVAGEALGATYRADPNVRKELRSQCAQSKLYASLGDPGEDGVLSNDERNAAIQGLKSELADTTVVERKPGY